MRERAIAALASRITEAPWTVGESELERASQAGLSDEGVVQIVTIVAVFNHLTRVADATGVESDYESPLPRIDVDLGRQERPRPARGEWPAVGPAHRFAVGRRPATAHALEAWIAYAREPSEALSRRDRQVLAAAVARATCDARGVGEAGDARPASPREETLARYAHALTVVPWRIGATDLEPLRALGLDDRGLFDVIAVVGTQNMASRVTLALG